MSMPEDIGQSFHPVSRSVDPSRRRSERPVMEPVAQNRPCVALMGEFSAGKSTLSNLLIGTEALPVNVTATQLPPVWLSRGTDAPYFNFRPPNLVAMHST